jgi:hypothetical protein
VKSANSKTPFTALSALLLSLALFGCEVESTSEGNQGVDLDDDAADDADSEADAAASGDDAGVNAPEAGIEPEAGAANPLPPVRGFVVVHSDFSSSSLSVIDVKGEVLSEQLVSSASAGAGASLSFSSDSILPSNTTPGGEIIVLDRGNSAVSWVDLERAEVTRQVNVGPGDFAANPYDYVQLSPTKAFVTRYETNPNAGEEAFDQGGDLLILNPSNGKLQGSVELASILGEDEESMQPHPDSVVFARGKLYVTVVTAGASFGEYGAPRLVTVDPASEEILDVLTLDGVKNCGEVSVSPNQQRLALSCWGGWGEDPTVEAGIVLVDINGEAPAVEALFAGEDLGVQPNALAFSSDDVVLFSTYGSFEPAVNDGLYSLIVAAGDEQGTLSESFLEAPAFSLSEVRCAPEAEVCVLADANTNGGTIQFMEIGNDGQIAEFEEITIAAAEGLPPRYLGTF